MPSCDPSSLANAARCFDSCVPPGQQQALKTSLLCAYANGSGPPIPVVPGATTDLDVQPESNENNIVLTWTNPIPNGTSVELWKSTDGVIYTLFQTQAGGSNAYLDATGMVDGDIWYYKVRNTDGLGLEGAFSNIVSVSFNLTLVSAGVISFPTLIRAFGFIDITGSTATQFNVPLLKSISGNFLGSGPPLVSVNFAALQTASGDITIAGNSSLNTPVSFPSLISAGGTIDFDNNPNLPSFSAVNLVTIGASLDLSNCTLLTSISLPALVSIGSGVSLSNIGGAALSFPSLQSMVDDFNAPNGGISSISMPSLLTVGGSLIAGGNASLITFSAPALTNVGLLFEIDGSSSLTSLTLTSLSTVGDAFQVENCLALPSLSLPALTSVATDFLAANCFLMTSVTMPNLVFTDGFGVDFSGNAIAVGVSASGTGINGILRRCVASGVTTDIIDLSGGTNATPGVSGLADKATLILAGNTVTTN